MKVRDKNTNHIFEAEHISGSMYAVDINGEKKTFPITKFWERFEPAAIRRLTKSSK